MKNGDYRVSFTVNLNGCVSEDDAHKALIALLVDSIEGESTFPEVSFELLEEEEPDYSLEEGDGVEELDFEEAV